MRTPPACDIRSRAAARGRGGGVARGGGGGAAGRHRHARDDPDRVRAGSGLLDAEGRLGVPLGLPRRLGRPAADEIRIIPARLQRLRLTQRLRR
jgi:hypothetical protein